MSDSRAGAPSKEMLENLDLLLEMEVIENETDWDEIENLDDLNHGLDNEGVESES